MNASYQDDKYSGSYSMYTYALGTDQFGSYIYNYKSLTDFSHPPYLVDDLSLDLWFKTKSNPDLTSGGHSYVYIYITDGASTYNLYYYFSYNGALPDNSTNQAFFDTRQSIGSWHHLQRNLTLDFEEAFPIISNTFAGLIMPRPNCSMAPMTSFEAEYRPASLEMFSLPVSLTSRLWNRFICSSLNQWPGSAISWGVIFE